MGRNQSEVCGMWRPKAQVAFLTWAVLRVEGWRMSLVLFLVNTVCPVASFVGEAGVQPVGYILTIYLV